MDLPFDLLDVGSPEGVLGLAGVLVVLALIDSTSFGTLAIPVWLLLAPGRPRPARLLVYLGTVAGFYLAVGLVVMAGAGVVLDRYQDALGSPPAWVAQLLLGVGLFALSFRFDGKRAARRRAEQESAGITPPPSRLSRWRDRALGVESGSPGATSTAGAGTTPGAALVRRRASTFSLVGLALAAAALEVATMLPYLAAIGIVTSSGLGTPASAAVLAGYCVVMVLPALLLLGGRLVAARLVEPLLRRVDAWFARNGEEMTGWVLGVVGALLALNAAGNLGIMG
ncbi:GAP family protein [Xylanimonas oleitrophica]|uniref:GAP family protein n=1 Tax=Xylanimonas oleitrophica TaxID=2607479 RepID=A0A2W5WLH3_9MICO|nr:GAP family protein [Xylanimonas oleitrophica]PZR52157.1 GAP family protein [Xylanimonas oleitrophica]